MKILQICNGYLGTKLYDKLFISLEMQQIENNIYVPIKKGMCIDVIIPKNAIVSKCFNSFDRAIFHLKQKKVLEDALRYYDLKQFDILHAHSLFSNGYIAYKLHQKYCIPYIVAVRNTDVNIFFKKMIHLRGLGIKIMKDAERIIFLSPEYKQSFILQYIPRYLSADILAKSVILPNGINDYFLSNKFQYRSMLDNKSLEIIYVGRINSNKNIETTIKACQILIKKGISVTYTIVGEIMDKKFNYIIKQYDFIKYKLPCDKKQVVEYMRNADIFVMPSIAETFGLVYAEAMSQGLPIIYSRGQGFDKQFEEGQVGYSVDCYNEREIAKKIISIVDRYDIISNSCVKLCDKFDWKLISDQYAKIYKEMI
jgi:glycosyltransferase involved in cell wall biosynthesis